MYHLMIKKAYPSGLLYLCQTKREPYAYKGSGLRWENHLKAHKPHIITCVIGEYETMEELKTAGLWWSEELDVVKSKEWANLRPEDGTGGGAGKVGRRWKIKDTSNMGGPKTRTQKVVDGYKKLSGTKNYQFKGWFVTPWGTFISTKLATNEALKLKSSGYSGHLIFDGATVHRYCLEASKPLSYAVRIPKERQGKTPSELGFNFIPKQND